MDHDANIVYKRGDWAITTNGEKFFVYEYYDSEGDYIEHSDYHFSLDDAKIYIDECE